MSREGLPFNPEEAGLEATGDGPYPQGEAPELHSAAAEQRRPEAEREEAIQRDREDNDTGGDRFYGRRGFWGNLKRDFKHTLRHGGIADRATSASLLVTFGLFGIGEAQKLYEYFQMGQKEKQLQVELGQLERLQQKENQVRELFGNNPHFHVHEKDIIEAKQDLLTAERRKFTIMPIVSDPDDRRHFEEAKGRVERLQQPQTEKEHEPTEVKTDITAHDYHGREVRINRVQLNDYVTRTFPKGWVTNEVASIEQTDEHDSLPKSYGIKGGESAAGCQRGWDRDTIIFYGSTKQDDMDWVLQDCLPHELGHANDWESDAEMSGEERLDLLLAVGERLRSQDRYRSSYVESIHNKDQQRELYSKAVEYWAEICSQYFRNPKAMDVKDFSLVDARVRKVDPNYDIDECRQERQSMIVDIVFPEFHER